MLLMKPFAFFNLLVQYYFSKFHEFDNSKTMLFCLERYYLKSVLIFNVRIAFIVKNHCFLL